MTRYVVAEFETPDAMRAAAQNAAESGFAPEDALSPFPVPGVYEHLATRRKPPVGWIMAGGGLFGACVGYFLQGFSAAVAYPFISGNRPFNSWPAFLISTYEVCILIAAFAGFAAFLWNCRLPRLYHPLFEITAIERAMQDRFFLVFRVEQETHLLMRFVPQLQPAAVHEVAG